MFEFLKKKDSAKAELEAERIQLLTVLECLHDQAMDAILCVYHSFQVVTPIGVKLAKQLKENEDFRHEVINSVDIDEDGYVVCPALERAAARCAAETQRRLAAAEAEFTQVKARLKEAYAIRRAELLNCSLLELPSPASLSSFMDIAGVHEYLQSYQQ